MPTWLIVAGLASVLGAGGLFYATTRKSHSVTYGGTTYGCASEAAMYNTRAYIERCRTMGISPQESYILLAASGGSVPSSAYTGTTYSADDDTFLGRLEGYSETLGSIMGGISSLATALGKDEDGGTKDGSKDGGTK